MRHHPRSLLPSFRPLLLLTALLSPFAVLAADALATAEQAVAAPACPLAIDASDAPKALAELRGKVVYLDFWASWCGPCRQSFPFMNALQSELGDKGLAVVAVNLDEEAADAASFLTAHPAQFQVAGGDNAACASAFQVEAMPSSYLIDRAGRVRLVHHGFRAGDAEALRAQLETLLAEPAP
ncbi:MAG: TlpA family protein disulfide reductase [Gammaproteobacteria bacterium]|nr:TlpA family protein disulfide reductase [Gammaproteobacteria bacterium]